MTKPLESENDPIGLIETMRLIQHVFRIIGSRYNIFYIDHFHAENDLHAHFWNSFMLETGYKAMKRPRVVSLKSKDKKKMLDTPQRRHGGKISS